MPKMTNSPRGIISKALVSGTTVEAGTLDLGTMTMAQDATVYGIKLNATSQLPGDVRTTGFHFLENATGQAFMVNTTGTTWKYLNVTTKQPT